MLDEEERRSSSSLLTAMVQSPGVTHGWLLPGTPKKIMTFFFLIPPLYGTFLCKNAVQKKLMRVRQNTDLLDPILDLPTDLIIKRRSVFCD